MSYSAVGKVWDPVGFSEHVAGLDCLGWADSVTVHHTGTPNLSQRPKGWTIQHMRNLAHFYGMKKGWSAGPHLFTDEDQVFGLSPLSARGIHARSFNAKSIGIEMLGNYDFEDPMASRGAQVIQCTVRTVAALLKAMGLKPTPDTIKFHRDDPRTSKTCPGSRIGKQWFVDLVKQEMKGDESELDSTTAHEPPVVSTHEALTPAKCVDSKAIIERIAKIRWQLDKLEDSLS